MHIHIYFKAYWTSQPHQILYIQAYCGQHSRLIEKILMNCIILQLSTQRYLFMVACDDKIFAKPLNCIWNWIDFILMFDDERMKIMFPFHFVLPFSNWMEYQICYLICRQKMFSNTDSKLKWISVLFIFHHIRFVNDYTIILNRW